MNTACFPLFFYFLFILPGNWQLFVLVFCRQASVALNVWQPEVIRDRQRQLVEQCAVPIDARLKDLEMDMRVCGKQIEVACKAYVSTEDYRFLPFRFIFLHSSNFSM